MLRADVIQRLARDDTGHAQVLGQRDRDCSSRAVCRCRCGNTGCPLVPARRPSPLCVCRYDVRTRRQRNHRLRKRLSRAAHVSDTGGSTDFAHALPDHVHPPGRALHRDGLLPRVGGQRHLDALLGSRLVAAEPATRPLESRRSSALQCHTSTVPRSRARPSGLCTRPAKDPQNNAQTKHHDDRASPGIQVIGSIAAKPLPSAGIRITGSNLRPGTHDKHLVV